MKILVNNIELNYHVEGQGHPFILLHGNGEDYHIFDKLVSKLCQHYKVYAIDSRNHGESTHTTDYAYETMAEDIHQFIQKLELSKPYVLGFSDGAIVALMLELKYPKTFAKMALLGINLSPSDFKEENLAMLKEWYAESNDNLVKLMLEQPNIELKELRNVTTPVLLIAAENDLYHSGLYANMMKEFAAAAYIEMKGHDHGSYVIGNDLLYPIITEYFTD